MKIIPLTKCREAIVDDEDYPLLARFNWYFSKNTYNDNGYAKRWLPRAIKHQPSRHGRMVEIMMTEMILPPQRNCTIDHINGNSLDNRKCNLRYATAAQQRANRGHGKGFKGRKYKGIYPARHVRADKWEAQIRVNGKIQQIGTFWTQEEAAAAYNEAATRLFGAFASLNILPETYRTGPPPAEPD